MARRKPFRIIKPKTSAVPILLSIPHSATLFPKPLFDQYKGTLARVPDDTDWFLDKLYDFAPGMGITVIKATYSRWVIDLNQSLNDEVLYRENEVVTDLCTTCDFFDRPIYTDERMTIEKQEVGRRLKAYYYPYHRALLSTLSSLREQADNVLLWDCHSVRRFLPAIRREKIPDLILSDADGVSASSTLIDTTLKELRKHSYSVAHNTPFKGGYITHQYGNPDLGLHALQLKISKKVYMDDTEQVYHPLLASNLKIVLQRMLVALTEELVNRR